MFRTPSLIVFGALVLTAGAGAQISPLRVTVTLAEYCGHTYVERPKGTSFVVFEGDQVNLRLHVYNADVNSEHVLVQSADSAGPAFDVNALRDRTVTPVRVAAEPDVLMQEGSSTSPLRWQTTLRIPARASISMPGSAVGPLGPGEYVLMIAARASDEKSLPLAPGRISFEVRPASPDAELEQLRRRSCYARLSGQADEARRLARELLERHPRSAEAHVLLGNISEQEAKALGASGDLPRARAKRQEANGFFAKALVLINGGSDDVYFRHATPEDVEQTVSGLRRRVRP